MSTPVIGALLVCAGFIAGVAVRDRMQEDLQ